MKIIAGLFLIGLVTASSISISNAQTSTSADTTNSSILSRSVFGIGAHFSPLSGAGVSFRHHLPGRLSYMLTGYVYKASDEITYNIGLELQYDIFIRERVRFYALAGVSHWYDVMRETAYNDITNSTYTYMGSNTFGGPDRLGAGIGLETNLIGESLCLSISGALVSFQPTGDLIIYPAGAIHYYFR